MRSRLRITSLFGRRMTLLRGGAPDDARPAWIAWWTATILVIVAGPVLVYAMKTRSSAQEGKRTVSLFSGGDGGTFLPIARALGDLSKEDPESLITVQAVSTSGSIANLDE